MSWALICDRQGRYDEAMSAFLEAKALLQPDAPPLLAQLESIINALDMRCETTSRPKCWRVGPIPAGNFSSRLAGMALLGGHARSGTTLLEQVLDSHPDIVSAEETDIFH